MVGYATLDEDLFGLLRDESSRRALCKTLLGEIHKQGRSVDDQNIAKDSDVDLQFRPRSEHLKSMQMPVKATKGLIKPISNVQWLRAEKIGWWIFDGHTQQPISIDEIKSAMHCIGMRNRISAYGFTVFVAAKIAASRFDRVGGIAQAALDDDRLVVTYAALQEAQVVASESGSPDSIAAKERANGLYLLACREFLTRYIGKSALRT